MKLSTFFIETFLGGEIMLELNTESSFLTLEKVNSFTQGPFSSSELLELSATPLLMLLCDETVLPTIDSWSATIYI